MPYSVMVEDFDNAQEDWERILSHCRTNTIFVTPWWQRVWWRHFGGQGDLHILSVRDGDEVVGVAPLMLSDGVVSFLGDTDLFDYHDFLVLPGREADFYSQLFGFLWGLDWHTLELKSVREGSPTLVHLPAIAEDQGCKVELTEEDVSPVASLPSTWDDYLATLRKKDRHELRRKLRRLEGSGRAEQYACTSPDTLSRCMHEFFQLMRSSSSDKHEFLNPQREEFFRDAALELASRGQFKLFFLEIDQVRVASCVCFDYDGTYLLYNSGYDPEYSPLSVGLLNKALCIKDAIEEGKQAFDFLRGTERYKYDLGGENQVVYQLTVRR